MGVLPTDFNGKLFYRLVDYGNSLFGWQDGVRLPQQRGRQHGDLKPEAAEVSGLCQPLRLLFLCEEIECIVYGNLHRFEV